MTSTADCPLRPLDDRVVVVRDPAETTHASGLHLPNPDDELTGTVVAVGPGRWVDGRETLGMPFPGHRVPVNVTVGDRVRFEATGGTAVEVDGEEWLLIPERHIVGVYQ